MVEGLCASSARPPGPCSLLGEGLPEKKQTDSDWNRRKRSKFLEGADIWELVETIIQHPSVIDLLEVCYWTCAPQDVIKLL
jgi:hypothetical protein